MLEQKPFFSILEKEEKVKPKPRSTTLPRTNKRKVFDCEVCGLYKNVKSPKMEPFGGFGSEVLIYGEAPGSEEDEKGRQFIGESGDLLYSIFEECGYDIDAQAKYINAIDCRPTDSEGKNRKPSSTEMISCLSRKREALIFLNPKVVLLFGDVAIDSFYSLYPEYAFMKQGKFQLADLRGRVIPDQNLGMWIGITYHPSFILRTGNDYKHILTGDIQKFCRYFGMERPRKDNISSNITIEKNYNKVLEVIDMAYSSSLVTLDFETSSYRYHENIHSIHSIAMTFDDGKTYSFPFDFEQNGKKFWTDLEFLNIRNKFINFLESDVKKVAQNIKHEIKASRKVLGVYPRNIEFCTMIGSHISEGTQGTTSLKTQVYLQFGVLPYDEHIKPYLYADPGKRNRYQEFPINDGLLYCGMDSKFTYRLYKRRNRYVQHSDLKPGYDLFHKASENFAKMELNGIRIDIAKAKRFDKEWGEEIEVLKDEILSSKEAKRFEKIKGRKLRFNKKFSDIDLMVLYYDIMKLEPPEKKTLRGYSVDLASLEDYVNENEIVSKEVRIRKMMKLVNTYLSAILKFTVGEFIYPSFLLHTARSYRGCVAKGSKILVVRDFERFQDGIPIEEVKVGYNVYCFDDNMKPAIRKVLWAGKTGRKKVVRIYFTKRGRRGGTGYLDVTPEHKVRLSNGRYVKAKDLIGADYRGAKESKHCSKVSVLSCKRSYDILTFTHNLGNKFGEFCPGNHVVTKVEYLADEVDVYDVEVDEYHNFFANELCVHNSSASPNFQNYPKHDAEWKVIRELFIPRPGNKLVTGDYGSMEVRIIAAISGDEVLKGYIGDNFDFHGDWAKYIFGAREDDKDWKEYRYQAKNKFVFRLFYGGSAQMAARDTVKIMPEWFEPRIKDKKDRFYAWMNHFAGLEKRFWKTFVGVKAWHNREKEFYQKHGYVSSSWGLRRYGVLNDEKIFNFPIQGPAFQCLLWSINKYYEYGYDEKWDALLCGEIHDDIYWDIPEDEIATVTNRVGKIMTEEIREENKWITVPLEVEWKTGDNWASMKDYNNKED
jgi:uracil-DNA glycosylase family 4